MANLYQVFIVPKTGITREQIEGKLNSASDWIRYQDRFYIIETNEDENVWNNRLDPLVEPSGYLFICKLDRAHYQGRMTPAFWKWWQSKKLPHQLAG